MPKLTLNQITGRLKEHSWTLAVLGVALPLLALARRHAHTTYWSFEQPLPFVGHMYFMRMYQVVTGHPAVRSIDETELGHTLWDGLHFTPIRVVLTPFVWLQPRMETILDVRLLLYAAAGLVVWRLARRLLEDEASAGLLGLAFLLHPIWWCTQVVEFRALQFAAPFLPILMACLLTGRWVLAPIAALLALSCREEVSLLLLATLPALAFWTWEVRAGPSRGRDRLRALLGTVAALLFWLGLVRARHGGTSAVVDIDGLILAGPHLLTEIFNGTSGYVLFEHYAYWLGPSALLLLLAPGLLPPFLLWGVALVAASAGEELGGPNYIVPLLGLLPLAWLVGLYRLRRVAEHFELPGVLILRAVAAAVLLSSAYGSWVTVRQDTRAHRLANVLFWGGGDAAGQQPSFLQPGSPWHLGALIPENDPVVVSDRLEPSVGHRPIYYLAKSHSHQRGQRRMVLQMAGWALLTPEDVRKWSAELEHAGAEPIMASEQAVLFRRTGPIDGDPITPWPEMRLE